MNASLFEWVIENLCKNAVDAMGGEAGSITLHLEENDHRAIIEVTDTGKGIKKKTYGMCSDLVLPPKNVDGG